MRWRPKRTAPPAPPRPSGGAAATPPLPPNPYRRFYTPTPTFEDLVRRARTGSSGSGNAESNPHPQR